MGGVIGIDPGKKGGIVIIKDGLSIGLEMPLDEGDIDLSKLSILFREWKDSINIALIEKQQSMTGQGVSSTFTTGYNYGLIHGLLVGVGIPIRTVKAKQWQKPYLEEEVLKELVDLSNMKESKKRSLSACKRLLPDLAIRTPRGRWMDGVADAALIALYGIEG
jgi:hypothetical protein